MTENTHAPARPNVWRRAVVALVLLGAVGLIAIGDQMLRRQQRLVEVITSGNVRVFLPFSDYLKEGIDKKSKWNTLHDQVAASRSAGNKEAFLRGTYDLAEYIGKEISFDDPRRRDVLLDGIAVGGELPSAENAYWALFDPAWQSQLRPQYPRYKDALLKLIDATAVPAVQPTGYDADLDQTKTAPLARLATSLHDVDEPAMELEVLRRLYHAGPITIATIEPIQGFFDRLPPADPDRAAVATDIQGYKKHISDLTAAAYWYSDFLTKTASASFDQMMTLRATAPAGPLNAFTASADARVIASALRAGRLDVVQQLRANLAASKLIDIAECNELAAELFAASASPTPDAANAKPPVKVVTTPANAPPPLQTPDEFSIYIQRWRGLLNAARFVDADALATELFKDPNKSLRPLAGQLRSAAAGDWKTLVPAVTLTSTSTNLPPELAGEGSALYAKLVLQPFGKTVPADLASVVELWVGKTDVVFVCSADESRRPLPVARATGRDTDVRKDDCFDLLFNADGWIDFYDEVTVNSKGVVYDARFTVDPKHRQQFKADKKFDLVTSASAQPFDRGWRVRFVCPRAKLFPADLNAVRFHARRMRWVTEKNAQIPQVYLWNPKLAGDTRTDQLGWVLFPGGNTK